MSANIIQANLVGAVRAGVNSLSVATTAVTPTAITFTNPTDVSSVNYTLPLPIVAPTDGQVLMWDDFDERLIWATLAFGMVKTKKQLAAEKKAK